MLLFVVLGNPGGSRADNRHNIGFMAVDEIARRHGFGPFRAKFRGDISEGRLAGTKVNLLKPRTYMNESGRSIGEVCRFYKIPTDDVFVFHDELDLPGGKVRVKTGGGHGGHNGLRSIDAHLDDKGYHRVRSGSAIPATKRGYTAMYSPISPRANERIGLNLYLTKSVARPLDRRKKLRGLHEQDRAGDEAPGLRQIKYARSRINLMGFNCGIVGLPNVGNRRCSTRSRQPPRRKRRTSPLYHRTQHGPGRRSRRPVAETFRHRGFGANRSTQLEFIDIAGLVRGASKGEGLGVDSSPISTRWTPSTMCSVASRTKTLPMWKAASIQYATRKPWKPN